MGTLGQFAQDKGGPLAPLGSGAHLASTRLLAATELLRPAALQARCDPTCAPTGESQAPNACAALSGHTLPGMARPVLVFMYCA